MLQKGFPLWRGQNSVGNGLKQSNQRGIHPQSLSFKVFTLITSYTYLLLHRALLEKEEEQWAVQLILAWLFSSFTLLCCHKSHAKKRLWKVWMIAGLKWIHLKLMELNCSSFFYSFWIIFPERVADRPWGEWSSPLMHAFTFCNDLYFVSLDCSDMRYYYFWRADEWVLKGISGYIYGLYLKKTFGVNEYRHWIKEVSFYFNCLSKVSPGNWIAEVAAQRLQCSSEGVLSLLILTFSTRRRWDFLFFPDIVICHVIYRPVTCFQCSY